MPGGTAPIASRPASATDRQPHMANRPSSPSRHPACPEHAIKPTPATGIRCRRRARKVVSGLRLL